MRDQREKSSISATTFDAGNPNPITVHNHAFDLAYDVLGRDDPKAVALIEIALKQAWQRGWVAHDGRKRRLAHRR